MIYSHLIWVITSSTFLILWFMFFTIHRDFHIARTRHRLFLIRSELFNAALEGKIGFHEPAYRLVRETLNGMIRFTHNLSFLRLIAIVALNLYAHKRLFEHFDSEFQHAFDELTLDQRSMLLKFIEKAHTQILRHLMSVSIFWIIFKLASIIYSWMNMTRSTRQRAMRVRQWRRFDAEAAYGISFQDNGIDSMIPDLGQ